MKKMIKYLNNPIVLLICRLIVGFIFLSYGASKIEIADKFAADIAKYTIMPEFSLNIFAIIIPWIELVVGVLLILGVRLRANSIISIALLTIFITFVAYAILMGLDINCGCSSTHPQKVGLPKIIENSGLILLSIVIFAFPNQKFTLEEFIINSANAKTPQ